MLLNSLRRFLIIKIRFMSILSDDWEPIYTYTTARYDNSI